MELAFEEKKMPYLSLVARQVLYQEETAESIVPDSSPDMARIVDCSGRVLLRSKDCRDGSVTISGGVQAEILYQAEEESGLRSLHVYLPFSVRVENPDLTGSAYVQCDCRIRSIDGRMLNPRKAMVRVNLGCAVVAFEPAEQSIWTLPEDSGLQVKRKTVPLFLMKTKGEKSFVVSEENELPSGRAAVSELYRWDTLLELTEKKLIGSRAVFKGTATIHLLYGGADGSLNTWSFQVPFSQYAELDQEISGEDVSVDLVLTGAELEKDGQEECRNLMLTLNVLAQCIAGEQEQVEIIEDLYSTEQQVTPKTATLRAVSLLDQQNLHQGVRETISAPVSQTLDTMVYLDFPTQERSGEQVHVTSSAQVSVLYLDEEGQAQSVQRRMDASCETQLHPDCELHAQAALTADAYAAPVPEGAEARFSVDFSLDSMAVEELPMVCGAEVSDREDTDEERPSIIIRAVTQTENLWILAKSCNTTVDAICKANGLQEDTPIAGTMLLIPMR